MNTSGGVVMLALLAGSAAARAQATTEAQKPSAPIPLVQGGAVVPAQQAPERRRTPPESALAAQNQAIRQQLRKEFNRKVQTQLGLNQVQMNRLTMLDNSYDKQRNTLSQQLSQVTQDLRQSLQHDPDTPDIQSKDSALEMQRLHYLGRRDDIDSLERNEMQTFLLPRQWIRFFALKLQLQAEVADATGQRSTVATPLLLPPPARRGGGAGTAGTAGAKPVKPDTGHTSSTGTPRPPRF